jgi:hypothetical protein
MRRGGRATVAEQLFSSVCLRYPEATFDHSLLDTLVTSLLIWEVRHRTLYLRLSPPGLSGHSHSVSKEKPGRQILITSEDHMSLS